MVSRPRGLLTISSRACHLARVTLQAVKTALVFFGETNGQMHLYLHSYLAENPIQVDAQGAAEEWLVKLACKPITTVTVRQSRQSLPACAARRSLP